MAFGKQQTHNNIKIINWQFSQKKYKNKICISSIVKLTVDDF